MYESFHVPYHYIDIDKEGISVSSLENQNISVIHISPSHHFPTGIVMPISRRYELLGWAARKPDRYIIEDDYDSELRLSGKPVPTLQSIDVSGHIIYINTFTKTLSSTVRISYMILPETLAEKYYETLSFYSCTVSNFEQYALAKFMANGSFEKHINRLRNYYQTKRDSILSTFKNSPLDKYITITEEESGVHFLMHINTPKTEEQLLLAARSKGIKLAPLSAYYNGFTDSSVLNTYVMNYSSINLNNLDQIAESLYQIVK
ncbi:PLP-dependent aminotransferase family protein [Coprococcus comes]|nr:PLP-dependent aminotransferase family protein [Coprococcus comes]